MAEPRWRLAADELPVRSWGGDYVVYNPLSGDTHIFDLVAGEILRALERGAGSEPELRQSVAALLEVPADAALAAEVRRIVAQLDELGLIEPACS
ncbi:MAG TPA: HPr-rel-A system PqqD family peptide chaperone [Burkholderiales bacterium]|jgi:PqqD family protein of HPr-rel-A system|nr:HPr-rel-A system PqqD family peptide chaperone [Burkholderiales bacterium]